MTEFMTMLQFMAKCEWEGGGLSSGFEYGLSATDISSDYPEFKAMVQKAEKHWNSFAKIEDAIREKFGDFEEQERDEDEYS